MEALETGELRCWVSSDSARKRVLPTIIDIANFPMSFTKFDLFQLLQRTSTKVRVTFDSNTHARKFENKVTLPGGAGFDIYTVC